jgi:hypothetical protein
MPTHRYRMKSSQRAICITLCVAGLFILLVFWGGVLTGRREPKILEMMFPVVYLVFAGTMTIRSYRNQVALSESAVELRSLQCDNILPLDKIKGRRRYFSPGDDVAPGIWHLVLESNDDRYPKLDIEELYRFDDAFYQWFNQLTDLDESDNHRPKTSNFGLV